MGTIAESGGFYIKPIKILIFNWRDIKNPLSGGAEVLTHEIAKRWVKEGNEVTIFSSEFSGCNTTETIDGVKIVRKGAPDARNIFTSVHYSAYRFYQTEAKGRFDVLIDEIHGLPFFTPLYVKEKKVVLICEVANELWVKMFGLFFGVVGRITEILYLRLFYKNIHFITISPSTEKELKKNGIKGKQITIIPMGISKPDTATICKKETDFTILYTGRLAKSKGIEETILAFNLIQQEITPARLWIIGRGEKDYVRFLFTLVEQLHMQNQVIFYDFVSEERKFELMSRAHLLLSPSMKEGFGLTIPESGSVGTPAIVYNVAGLTDVVKNGLNGVICIQNTPEELARNAVSVFRDKKMYKKLCEHAIAESKNYNWDITAKKTLHVLQNL